MITGLTGMRDQDGPTPSKPPRASPRRGIILIPPRAATPTAPYLPYIGILCLFVVLFFLHPQITAQDFPHGLHFPHLPPS